MISFFTCSQIITESDFYDALFTCGVGLGLWGISTTWNAPCHFPSFGLAAQVFDKEALKVFEGGVQMHPDMSHVCLTHIHLLVDSCCCQWTYVFSIRFTNVSGVRFPLREGDRIRMPSGLKFLYCSCMAANAASKLKTFDASYTWSWFTQRFSRYRIISDAIDTWVSLTCLRVEIRSWFT